MTTTPIASADAANARVGAAQRELLVGIAEVGRTNAWEGDGARDLAHWVSIRYGISHWKASRWVHAAQALEGLPKTASALADGTLSLDQVVELCRFATPETEAGLIRWARTVSVRAIRLRADREVRRSITDTQAADRERSLSWWWTDEGRRLGLEAELPAAEGAKVIKTIERLSRELPQMPGEEAPIHVEQRRADALVALCSGMGAEGADPDTATVVVHARLGASRSTSGPAELPSVELEDGPVLHPTTLHRLLCSARVQTIVEDETGDVLQVGRMRREPSSWLRRQVRYRDRECRFPGCGARRFTEPHHLVWWRHGGTTELSNLLLICSFHHKLVHEHGWGVKRRADGEVWWFRPDGVRYRAGPGVVAAG